MQLSQIYKSLSDESRLRIVNILQHGLLNVQEITTLLALSQPTVSHHLKILAQVGLIKAERNGTHIYYSLASDSGELSENILSATLKACEISVNQDQTVIYNQDLRAASKIIEERRKQTQSFFNRIAPEWNELRSQALGQENFLDKVGALINPKDSLLDLGCGSGALLEILLPREGETIGVDCSEAMLQEARQRLSSRARSVDLRLGYMEHLPVGDETVDKAVAYMALHHIPNPLDALKETARALKPSGQLIIVDLLKHNVELMRTEFADIWLGFEQAQLKKWLTAAGFQNLAFEPIGKLKESFILTCCKN